MRILLVVLASLFICTGQVHAWGNLGHEAIAAAAQQSLDQDTSKAIAKILGHGSSLPKDALSSIATWPDEIRARKSFGTSASGWSDADKHEADTFNRDHKHNDLWHFVNLPLAAASYPDLKHSHVDDPVEHFTSADDIVHAIDRCISILETEQESPVFTKQQALRWLVHLVGDIHQPLHVTTGYYQSDKAHLAKPKLIIDPAEAMKPGVLGDRGANGLLFSQKNEENNLHALWDKCLVQLVAGTGCSKTPTEADHQKLNQSLASLAQKPKAAGYKGTGDYHNWAEQWATDSLKMAASSQAYTMSLTDGHAKVSHQGEAYMQISIKAPPTKEQYIQDHKTVVADQLTKAAVRLADLLNHLQWK